MKKLVVIPGGFHPPHSGHIALYNAAKTAFPSADVYVAATADTSTRPFPFKTKKMLAVAAGIPANRFIQVKSPFRAEEITQHFDPSETQLIYVRSEKDRDTNPQPGTVKKSGEPGYLQPYKRKALEPMTQHAYMAYLPVQQFGAGMTSATEIRSKWPEMTPDQKTALIKTMYPAAAQNPTAVEKLVEIMDNVLDSQGVSETVETVGQDAVANKQAVAEVIGHLSQVVGMLQRQDFDSVKAVLTDPALLSLLDKLTGAETGADHPNSVDDSSDGLSDYADEI